MIAYRDGRQVIMCDGCYAIHEIAQTKEEGVSVDTVITPYGLPPDHHLCSATALICEAARIVHSARRPPYC